MSQYEFIGYMPRNPVDASTPQGKRNGWAGELFMHLCAGSKAHCAHAWFLRQASLTKDCEEYEAVYEDPDKRVAWVEKWGCVIEEIYVDKVSRDECEKVQAV